MRTRRDDFEERFALEYIQDLDAPAAYRRIRPNVTPGAARTMASRLLTKVDVQARIKALRVEQVHRLKIEADRVLQELAVVAFSDILNDYQLDEQGHLRLSDAAHPTAARALACIKRKVRTGRNGERGRWTEYETEYRLWPKVEALTKLAQHLGLLKDPQAGAGGCEIILGADESVTLVVRGKC
jgi:phage terminase small subunit